MPSGWPRVILWCLLVLTRNQRCSAGSALSRHGLARWVKLAELRRLVDLGCVRRAHALGSDPGGLASHCFSANKLYLPSWTMTAWSPPTMARNGSCDLPRFGERSAQAFRFEKVVSAAPLLTVCTTLSASAHSDDVNRAWVFHD